MKKLITILAVLLISANSIIQAQDCLWAQSAGGAISDYASSVCSDASGNVYVTGSFYGPTITFGTITLTSGGPIDIFIIKYAPDGTVLWARSAGGASADVGSSISLDVNGNILVTGNFNSTSITFGTITLINGANNTGVPDIFIVKYSPDGTVLWANSAGNNGDDSGQSVSTDASGNVYVIGSFSSDSITLGSIILTNTSEGEYDIFIVKYSPNGNVLWAKSISGSNDDYGYGISTDTSGYVYVTGNFESPTITFGTTTLTNTNAGDISNIGDIFIAKFTSDGNVLWANAAGGNEYDKGNSISTDSNGNVYVTGYFTSDTLTIGTTNLISSGIGENKDIFIAKYSTDGSHLWAKSAGGSNTYIDNGISTDANGNVYLTGGFNLPTIAFGTTMLTNTFGGFSDVFIVKYAQDGTVLWAKSAGGNGNDIGKSISVDASSNVYLIGNFFSPTMIIGTTTLTNASNIDFMDFFIAKYSGESTGVTDPFANHLLIVSPNPTNSSITINIPALKNSNVTITTLTGTEVGNYNTQNTSTQTIDISHLASGVYFVSLKSEEGGVVTKKIIKQ
jgi:hypothetical protein